MNRSGMTRAAAVSVSVAAFALAGCSSSGGLGSGSISVGAPTSDAATSTPPFTTAESSSAPAPSSSSSSAPSSSSSSSSGAVGTSASAACADVKQLDKLANAAGSIGNNLTKGRLVLNGLGSLTTKLVNDAPADLHITAQRLQQNTQVLVAAVNKAKTLKDLQNASRTDPKVKAAAAGLTTNGNAVDDWSKKNCK